MAVMSGHKWAEDSDAISPANFRENQKSKGQKICWRFNSFLYLWYLKIYWFSEKQCQQALMWEVEFLVAISPWYFMVEKSLGFCYHSTKNEAFH